MSTDYLRKLALFVQHTTSTYPCSGLAPVPHVGSRIQSVGSVVVIGSRAEGEVPTGRILDLSPVLDRPNPAVYVRPTPRTGSRRVHRRQEEDVRGKRLVMVGRLSGLLFSHE